MRLVVDTSIIFSLFKSSSFTNKLLQDNKLRLFAPKSLSEELFKYSTLISAKSGISEDRVLNDIALLSKLIDFRTPSQSSLETADKLISHKTDVPFLALALELRIPIWSNDAHFKEQSSIRVFTTEELSAFLTSA